MLPCTSCLDCMASAAASAVGLRLAASLIVMSNVTHPPYAQLHAARTKAVRLAGEQVVSALGEPGRRHVPFRATALTRALRGALGGAVRTTLVACVWDSPAHASETLATCRCAQHSVSVIAFLLLASCAGMEGVSIRDQLHQCLPRMYCSTCLL